LKLLYDAAHAFGCTYQGRGIGGFGDAAVFSFHATKVFNTFEGGAIATNDDQLAARIRLVKRFGFADLDTVECLGTNAKMSEVSAAMGLTNLRSLDQFIEANRRNHGLYREELRSVPGLSAIQYDDRNERCNYQYAVLEVDSARCGLSRDQLLRVLQAENIMARRYFWPGCHRMQPYRSLFPEATRRLAHTERLAERVLVLPTGTAVSEQDVATISDVLRAAVAQADSVRQALSCGTASTPAGKAC
jgi:dTDP-4-amino-4,6-dideoxygalactose transaminase